MMYFNFKKRWGGGGGEGGEGGEGGGKRTCPLPYAHDFGFSCKEMYSAR